VDGSTDSERPAPPSPEPKSRTGRWPRTFQALRHRNFRLYWFGQIVSLTGTWMQIVAQSWLVYRLTDSPLMLGLVNVVGLLPVVPISLLGGAISDRVPRRNLILVTEIVLMGQAFVLALLTWSGMIQVWHVMVLSFVLGAAAALEQPARLAFIMDVVGKEDLVNAVALNSSVYNAARIVGPAIAGVLVAAIGEAGCFFVNSVTYLAVILALLAIRLPQQAQKPGEEPVEQPRLAGSVVDGLKYTWNTRVIRSLMIIVALSSFLTLPYIALMPVFAGSVFQTGPEGLGFLMTSVGVGAITGALIVANARPGHRGRWLTAANVVAPMFLLLFCLSQSFLVGLALVLLVGGGNAVRQTLANSMIQLNTAEVYHGRVMSVFNLTFNGMSRVGALVIGGVAEFTGAPLAVGAGAAVSVLVGVAIIWLMPEVRQLT
jgi:MFS family permease